MPYTHLKIELDETSHLQPRIMAKYGSDYYRVQEVRYLDDPEGPSWLQVQFPDIGTTVQISDPEAIKTAKTYATAAKARKEEKKVIKHKRGPNQYKFDWKKNGNKSKVKSL